jgi:predicted phage terminase large subunit-like protein
MMAHRIDQIDCMLAEKSLADFMRLAWPVLEPRTRYLDNWHIALLCEYLEAVAAGEETRLIINVPPRSGKSLLATIMFPCWVWTKMPGERFMFASYSAALSTQHSVSRRTLIQSPWYAGFWGNIVKLADDTNLKTEFANTQRGHMIATSVGGSATGRGGRTLIVDDLINPSQANSDLERKAAIRWFDEVYSTRLDDKLHGAMIVIEQRTHQADLTGHLLEQGGWVQLSLAAIATRKTILAFPKSRKEVVRDEEGILWPAREGRVELDAIKIRLGSFGFEAQYQQAPISREGNLIKIEWLSPTYQAGSTPGRYDSIVMSLDTAFKTGNSNDYSACVIIGVLRRARDGYPPGYYLLDAWRGRVTFAELKRQAIQLQQKWNAGVVLIEDAASGQSLIQELRAGTILPVRAVKPDADKFSRVAAVCPILEGRNLILPREAWWRADFIAELLSFPAGAFDDWIDALAQALNYLRVSNDSYENALTAVKLMRIPQCVEQGLSVEEIAEHLELSVSQVSDYIEKRKAIFERFGRKEEDPIMHWGQSAERLIDAFRQGHAIEIDRRTYTDYIRGRLITSTDPVAKGLLDHLDKRFRIPGSDGARGIENQSSTSIEDHQAAIMREKGVFEASYSPETNLDRGTQWCWTRHKALALLATRWPNACHSNELVAQLGDSPHVQSVLETLEKERLVECPGLSTWKFKK